MSRRLAAALAVGVGALLLLANASMLASGSDALARRLEFDATRIFHGEDWRLLTGHLVHWSREHAALDLAAILALLPLAGARAGLRALLLSFALIGPVLLLAGPDVYRGSSALAAALFTCAACRALRSPGASRLLGAAGLLAMVAKVAAEALLGEALFLAPAPGEALLPAPVALAHALGALAGALAASQAAKPRS